MSRVHLLRTSAVAVMTFVAALFAGSIVSAQEASPEATPEAESAAFLFVQSFTSGTWTPESDEEFTLTLNGVAISTIYFSERPARVAGLMPTGDLLDSLGFTRANPPNAALVIQSADGDQDVLIVELFSPIYDASTGVLTYQTKVLADYDEEALASLVEQQTDSELPPAFGAGSLFIDHHHCPEPLGCL